MKKTICLILSALLLLGMAGFVSAPEQTQSTSPAGLVLTNSILGEDYPFTYPGVPQRIVSLASPATEMLLALGLEESIVGYAMQDNKIPARYKTAFDSLYCITRDWNVSKEMILALEPDFLMFWNGSADYDYEFLTANGISTYTMTSDIPGAKADHWIEYLENHPAMQETRAVRSGRYIVVGLADLTVGERIADTVGLLAAHFHPEG